MGGLCAAHAERGKLVQGDDFPANDHPGEIVTLIANKIGKICRQVTGQEWKLLISILACCTKMF